MDPKKDQFDWQHGQVLDEENSKPLGGVRVKGSQKLAEALHADPDERVQAREKHLNDTQSQKYRETVKDKKDIEPEEISMVIGEDHSDVTGEMSEDEVTKAKHLLEKGDQLTGISRRFGKTKKDDS